MAEADLTLGVVLGLLIGIPVGIGVGWFITQVFMQKPQQGSLTNLEEWEVLRDKKGLPQKVRVHREVENRG